MERKRFFLTGGTGFVGSFLAVELMKKGHFITFLARSKGDLSATERVDAAVQFVDPQSYGSYVSSYNVVEGDITKEDLGLSPSTVKGLGVMRYDSMFHFAASVTFDEKHRRSTFLINRDGASNIVDLAARIRVKSLRHISTLYVAGNREGTVYETVPEGGQSFNNSYEESKASAEALVLEWSGISGIPVNIYRLPIVLGDSLTGKALSFTGFYGFFKAFWRISRKIRKKTHIDTRPGEREIHLEEETVPLPLTVRCGNNSRIDLLPVDWVTRNIRLLSDKPIEPNRIFHLSHPSAPSSREIIRTALGLLGIRGIRFLPSDTGMPDSGRLDRVLAVWLREQQQGI